MLEARCLRRHHSQRVFPEEYARGVYTRTKYLLPFRPAVTACTAEARACLTPDDFATLVDQLN
jgi:hypothetical protein